MMSDDVQGGHQRSLGASIPQTPEEAVGVWREEISSLPPIDHDEVKRIISESRRVDVPEQLLTYGSFLRILAKVQNIKTKLLDTKAIVDEHYIKKTKAVKNLQKILITMSDKKTVKEREGDAENWLIHLHRLTSRVEVLKALMDDAIENLEMVMTQLGRQVRVADMAVRTQTIDVTTAIDLPLDWGEFDDEDMPWIERRSGARRVASQNDEDPKDPEKEGDDEDGSRSRMGRVGDGWRIVRGRKVW